MLSRFRIVLLLDFGVFTKFSRINTVWVSRFTHLPMLLLVQKCVIQYQTPSSLLLFYFKKQGKKQKLTL